MCCLRPGARVADLHTLRPLDVRRSSPFTGSFGQPHSHPAAVPLEGDDQRGRGEPAAEAVDLHGHDDRWLGSGRNRSCELHDLEVLVRCLAVGQAQRVGHDLRRREGVRRRGAGARARSDGRCRPGSQAAEAGSREDRRPRSSGTRRGRRAASRIPTVRQLAVLIGVPRLDVRRVARRQVREAGGRVREEQHHAHVVGRRDAAVVHLHVDARGDRRGRVGRDVAEVVGQVVRRTARSRWSSPA